MELKIVIGEEVGRIDGIEEQIAELLKDIHDTVSNDEVGVAQAYTVPHSTNPHPKPYGCLLNFVNLIVTPRDPLQRLAGEAEVSLLEEVFRKKRQDLLALLDQNAELDMEIQDYTKKIEERFSTSSMTWTHTLKHIIHTCTVQ